MQEFSDSWRQQPEPTLQEPPRKRGLLDIACLSLLVIGFAFGLIPLAGNIFRIALGLSGLICGVVSMGAASKLGQSRDTLVFAAAICCAVLAVWGTFSLIGTISIIEGLGTLAGDLAGDFREWLATL